MYTIKPGKLVIPPPREGACRLCGEIHEWGEPHNRDSLIYQSKFRQNHERYPTWEDAMWHCSEAMKRRFIKKLERHGVKIETKEPKETKG